MTELRRCPNGHDKDAEGVYGKSGCRRCARDRSARRNRKRRPVAPGSLVHRYRLPARPLVEAVDAWIAVGGRNGERSVRSLSWRYADRFGVARETAERFFSRLRDQTTVTVDQGDQVAVVLGLHPVLIWPAEWEAVAS